MCTTTSESAMPSTPMQICRPETPPALLRPITCCITMSRGNGQNDKENIFVTECVDLDDTACRNVALQRLASKVDKKFTKEFKLAKKREERDLQLRLLKQAKAEEEKQKREALAYDKYWCGSLSTDTRARELAPVHPDVHSSADTVDSNWQLCIQQLNNEMFELQQTLYKKQCVIEADVRGLHETLQLMQSNLNMLLS